MTKTAKLLRILRRSIYRRALRRGAAAGVEHEALLHSLRCGSVVDIGANRGQFALAARGACAHASIVSFDPLAGPARVFRRVFAHDPATTLHPVAIGPCSKRTTIHVSARDDSSSLLPITPLQAQMFPGTAELGTETIRVEPLHARLSALDLASPALLKLDVQGYELPTLEGCTKLLPHFDHVYVECSFVELYEGQALAHHVVAYLQARGFQLDGIYNVAYGPQGQAVQADFLFARAT